MNPEVATPDPPRGTFRSTLQCHKRLYRIATAVNRTLHRRLRLIESLVGLKSRFWQQQSREAVKGYWSLRNDVRKARLLGEAFRGLRLESLLEIGCNCGPNLVILSGLFPSARFTGIDISSLSVHLGNQWLAEAGLGNINLQCRKAEDLSSFEDGSVDFVFSWATLIYPVPSSILEILRQMLRIARKGLVLVEMQYETRLRGRRARGVFVHGEWKRDYLTLFAEIAPSCETSLQPVERELWSPGGGGAAVITVHKK
jgi:ubiquinone/menaquinone biosynthesis C-methylase UbiE